MLRKESEVVPEDNGPVHHQDGFGSGQPTLVYPFQRLEEIWDRIIDVITRLLEQHLTSLEPGARQPRLSIMADGPANMKTRERMEGAATAVQAMHGDSCTSQRVQDGTKTSTSFCVKAEPPDLPCREDVLVENGAASPKSCRPSLEMRSPSAAGGLLPAADTSTATRTTSNKLPLRLYAIEETNSKENKIRTSMPSTWNDSSFWKLLAAPFCQRVIKTKYG